MNYEQLSREAKATIKGMIKHCLDSHYCMGMDGGFDENDEPNELRLELLNFIKED